MKTALICLLLLAATTDAARKVRKQRQNEPQAQNSYGDEQVLPAAAVEQNAQPQQYGEQDAAVVAAAPAAAGYEDQAVHQQPAVESSGYRFKRDNSYGDEQIVPADAAVQNSGSQQYAEEDAAVVAETQTTGYEDQAVHHQPAVESSGYRFKRDNSYGDELVVPEDSAVVKAEETTEASYGEQDVAVANSEEESYAGEAQPVHNAVPVEESGYRHKRSIRHVKRGNEYGDEQIVPEVTVEDAAVHRADYAETAAVVAQVDSYEPAAPSAAVSGQVERSGYRHKRSIRHVKRGNEYGDEQIVPEGNTLQSAGVEAAEVVPEVVDQSYVVAAARPSISPPSVQVHPVQFVQAKQSTGYGEEAVLAVDEHTLPVRHLRYAEVPLTYGALFSSGIYQKPHVLLASGYRNKMVKKAKFVKRRLH